MAQSNSVLIDGVPIEDILNSTIADNYCESCSKLIGKITLCRTVIYEGIVYEDIPAKAIRHAVHHMLGGKPEREE